LKNERGAISVFIILIIVPIFLFQAVLIEFVRSRLANQQLELAVKAALHSVGATYNTELQKYGLYGVSRSGANAVYAKVVSENTGQGLASTRALSHSLQFSRSLADPDVFANQIMEEMKYRAPIEYQVNIINKLIRSGIGKAMNDMTEFAEKAEEMDQLAKKRDEALKRVWKSFADWDAWISGSFSELQSRVVSLEPEHSEMRRVNLSELQQRKESLLQSKRDLEQKLKELDEEEEREEKDRDEEEERREQDPDTRQAEKEKLLEQIKELDQEIEAVEQQIRRYNEWLSELQAIKDRFESIVREIETIGGELINALDEAAEYNDQIKEKAEAWRDDFGGEMFDSAHTVSPEDIQLIRGQTTALRHTLISMRGDFLALRTTGADALAAKMSEYMNRWNRWMEQVKAAQAEQEERESRQEEEHRQAEKKLQEQIDQVLAMLTGCVPENADDEKQAYAFLKERTHGGLLEENESDLYGEGRDAKEDARSLAKMIGQLSERLTEKLYISEYALVSFNYRTYNKTGNNEKALTRPSSHPLKNQEVEYILYGFHSCSANYSAAYWEIFATRLAVRTLESLTDPKKSWRFLGSPLLAFLWALAEGAVKAYEDTERLKKGEEVPLFKMLGSSFTFNYSDYLRLFLLLHGGKEDRIRRMQALVELNTGQQLSEHYTYWVGKTEGEMRSFLLGAYTYYPKAEAAWGYY